MKKFCFVLFKKFCLILSLMSLISTTGFAANVDSFGIGSKATALGGAFSAYADDPFAVYYNPGGLVQIKQPEVSVGFHIVMPTLHAKDFHVDADNPDAEKNPIPGTFEGNIESCSFDDDSDPLFVPHIGYAMPLSDSLYFGIAAYVPYGLDIEWDKDTDSNPGAFNYFHSWYIREVVNPTIAYKINDKISFGVGVAIGKSKCGEERYLYYPKTSPDPAANAIPIGGGNTVTWEDAVTGGYLAQGATLEQAQAAGTAAEEARQGLERAQALHGHKLKGDLEDDLNYSFNAGILYQVHQNLSMGLTYRGRTDTNFKGDLYLDGHKTGTKLKLHYDHPQQVQFGIRYITEHKISLELDSVWTNWSIGKNQDVSLNPDFNGKIVDHHDRNWNDTFQIRFGVEYDLNKAITLRGGYFYDPSPIPDYAFDLMWPDGDRKTYSCGAGFNISEKFSIDTIFEYAYSENTRSIGGESDNLNHSYNPYAGTALDNDAKVSFNADGHLFGFGLTCNYTF